MLETQGRTLWPQRVVAMLGALVLSASLTVAPATAADFTIDPDTQEAAQVGTIASRQMPDSCPTLQSAPGAIEAWFNTDDMDYRGYMDPKNQRPWSFINKAAQVICGAKQGSNIQVVMYFVRAIGTADRPESDSQMIWNALRYVKKNRGVKVDVLLDGGGITSAAGKENIKRELADIDEKIDWCYNGCFNTNKSSVFPYAINHEKFVTISQSIWDDKPLVYSSSGQFARSQVRTYWQEATLFYGDVQLHARFRDRFFLMQACSGSTRGSDGCRSGSALKAADAKEPLVPSYNSLRKERGIWVDKKYRHFTDSGRGTSVSFSPQDNTVTDYYTTQFGDVDCGVDKKIRVAMYRLTDTRAPKFIEVMGKLKRAGCDVKVLLSQKGGATTISNKVAKALKRAGLTSQVRCTAIPIHTKLILIGPADNNSGRVMMGTANMSTSGLRYSEEHVITMDSRRITDANVARDFREAYGVYLAGWNELNQGSKVCH